MFGHVEEDGGFAFRLEALEHEACALASTLVPTHQVQAAARPHLDVLNVTQAVVGPFDPRVETDRAVPIDDPYASPVRLRYEQPPVAVEGQRRGGVP